MRTSNFRRETAIEMGSGSDTVGMTEQALEKMMGQIIDIDRKRGEDGRWVQEKYEAINERVLFLESFIASLGGRGGGESGNGHGKLNRQAQYQSEFSHQRSGTYMEEVINSLLSFLRSRMIFKVDQLTLSNYEGNPEGCTYGREGRQCFSELPRATVNIALHPPSLLIPSNIC